MSEPHFELELRLQPSSLAGHLASRLVGRAGPDQVVDGGIPAVPPLELDLAGRDDVDAGRREPANGGPARLSVASDAVLLAERRRGLSRDLDRGELPFVDRELGGP